MSWRTAVASPLPGSSPRRRTSSRTSSSTIWSAVCWPAVVMARTRWWRWPGRSPATGGGCGGAGRPGAGTAHGASGAGPPEGRAGEQGGVDPGAVVGHRGRRLDADIAAEGGADLLERTVAAEHAGAQLVDHDPDPAGRRAELAQLLVAADEGVQPDRVGPGHGHDQVGL